VREGTSLRDDAGGLVLVGKVALAWRGRGL